MDSKFGRLFTERDVLMLMKAAHDEGWRTGTDGGGSFYRASDGLRGFEEEPPRHCAPLTFPPDEPLFLLRGQDIAAPGTIFNILGEDRYDYLDRAKCAGAPDDHLRAIEVAGRKMAAWQKANPERVKVPG